MRKLLSICLCGSLPLFAATPQDIFPDALSADANITFNKKVFIENSGIDLTAPIISINETKAHCDQEECIATGTRPAALAPFTALQSSNGETVTVSENTTLSDSDIGHIVIGADNLTIIFDAPAPEQGFNPLQKIASITDNAKNTTYVFKAGDYHIGSVVISNPVSVQSNDTLTVMTEGDARLYIAGEFTILKMEKPVPGENAININADKTAKSLIIFASGAVDINTDADFVVNAYIYGYDNVRLNAKQQSHFKGAIHSDSVLKIGLDNPPLTAIMTIAYDPTALNDLYVFGNTLQALPDEPDPAVNNTTLLGIDANRNGVRDDVERYLLEKYKDAHPVVLAMAMQAGRAWQIILVDPANARNTTKYIEAAQDCNYYFESSAKSYGDPILIDHLIMDDIFENLQLNTKERMKAYLDYNHNLSGGVFSLSKEEKAQCDFNVTELLKIQP